MDATLTKATIKQVIDYVAEILAKHHLQRQSRHENTMQLLDMIIDMLY